MTWQENGRFHHAALLLASDTPEHPAKSQTQTMFVMPYRTLHTPLSRHGKKKNTGKNGGPVTGAWAPRRRVLPPCYRQPAWPHCELNNRHAPRRCARRDVVGEGRRMLPCPVVPSSTRAGGREARTNVVAPPPHPGAPACHSRPLAGLRTAPSNSPQNDHTPVAALVRPRVPSLSLSTASTRAPRP